MMNNAVTAPALSSTWTCAPIELDRARVGVRASRFAAHHGAQHVSRCIMTPDICPSTASVQPSTLDSGEASIYVQLIPVNQICRARTAAPTDPSITCAAASALLTSVLLPIFFRFQHQGLNLLAAISLLAAARGSLQY